MNLLEILHNDYPVSEETASALASVAAHFAVRKKEFLVRQGSVNHFIYFITEGLMRGTSEFDGREDTLFFAVAGDPFLSVHTMAHSEPSVISLQALEDSSVLAVSLSDFNIMLDTYADLRKWWSSVLLEQVYALERRYVWLSTSNATERYRVFMRVRRNIAARIPVKYIAQYLNIAPETLSRIRGRRDLFSC